jgi:hypothetical protein
MKGDGKKPPRFMPGVVQIVQITGGPGMKYWRINTDSDARDDLRTCDLWYQFGMVFTGDFAENKRKHDTVLLKLSPSNGVFMHHSGLGLVGYGIVKEKWNGQTYQGAQRRLYVREPYEYRIAVEWDLSCDCREDPLPIFSRLPYMGTYSCVDSDKWDVQSVIRDLRKRVPRLNDAPIIRKPAFADHTEGGLKVGHPTTDDLGTILSRIGGKVSFKYPGSEGDKHGILKDRVVVESTNDPGAVPYWDVVDLIQFKDERESEWIRIGYYRKPKQKLNWGSQTTITEPISIWKRILVNAAREKTWFRDLLEDVLNELKK